MPGTKLPSELRPTEIFEIVDGPHKGQRLTVPGGITRIVVRTGSRSATYDVDGMARPMLYHVPSEPDIDLPTGTDLTREFHGGVADGLILVLDPGIVALEIYFQGQRYYYSVDPDTGHFTLR